MAWLVRRLLAPFLAGGGASAALLLSWALLQPGSSTDVSPRDAWLALSFVFPFQAAGLLFFLPIGLALKSRTLFGVPRLFILAVDGAAIGALMVLPISEPSAPVAELALPAACGAIGAVIWLAFNREAKRC